MEGKKNGSVAVLYFLEKCLTWTALALVSPSVALASCFILIRIGHISRLTCRKPQNYVKHYQKQLTFLLIWPDHHLRRYAQAFGQTQLSMARQPSNLFFYKRYGALFALDTWNHRCISLLKTSFVRVTRAAEVFPNWAFLCDCFIDNLLSTTPFKAKQST